MRCAIHSAGLFVPLRGSPPGKSSRIRHEPPQPTFDLLRQPSRGDVRRCGRGSWRGWPLAVARQGQAGVPDGGQGQQGRDHRPPDQPRAEQQRALPPEQAASASGQILERLIDQELALQKAETEARPRSARRAAARGRAPRNHRPRLRREGRRRRTEADAGRDQGVLREDPALFSERRVYSFRKSRSRPSPSRSTSCKKLLTAPRLSATSSSTSRPTTSSSAATEAVRAAEQLPLNSLERLPRMKDGQAVLAATPTGAGHRAGRLAQPAGRRCSARPRRSSSSCSTSASASSSQTTCRRMRTAAKIEYVGEFAKNKPPPRPGAAASDAPPVMSIAPAASSRRCRSRRSTSRRATPGRPRCPAIPPRQGPQGPEVTGRVGATPCCRKTDPD